MKQPHRPGPVTPSLIGLIAVLSYMLLRSAPRTSLRFWTAAWACLAIGLATLLLSFVLPAVQWVLQTVYLLGEYTFGYLFYAGCRIHVTGARPRYFGKTGTSDANLVHERLGIPVVAYGPGNDSGHKPDEHVRISDLGLVAEAYAHLMVGYFR